jgi:hypothetical protein
LDHIERPGIVKTRHRQRQSSAHMQTVAGPKRREVVALRV